MKSKGCDPLFAEAVKVFLRFGRPSVALLQRRLGVGARRAARICDEIEAAGIIGLDCMTDKATTKLAANMAMGRRFRPRTGQRIEYVVPGRGNEAITAKVIGRGRKNREGICFLDNNHWCYDRHVTAILPPLKGGSR